MRSSVQILESEENFRFFLRILELDFALLAPRVPHLWGFLHLYNISVKYTINGIKKWHRLPAQIHCDTHCILALSTFSVFLWGYGPSIHSFINIVCEL